MFGFLKKGEPTFTEVAAEARKAGWDDIIGIATYADELSELDRFTADAIKAAAPQLQDREQLYKNAFAPSRGAPKLQRLALAALQSSIWALQGDARLARLSYLGTAIARLLLSRKLPPDDAYI